MATGPIELVVGTLLAASALTMPALPAAPAAAAPVAADGCGEPARWETDAQALADALAGVAGDADADRLRRQLDAAGFVPGGALHDEPQAASEGTADLADLVTGLLAALAGGTDREAQVIVIGPGGTVEGTTGGCADAGAP